MIKPIRDPESIPPCRYCGGGNSIRKGRSNGYQTYLCKDCGKRWSESPYPKGVKPSGLTKAERNAKWKRENRAKCTERDRIRRQERKLELQKAEAEASDEAISALAFEIEEEVNEPDPNYGSKLQEFYNDLLGASVLPAHAIAATFVDGVNDGRAKRSLD